jgi:B12 binding domain
MHSAPDRSHGAPVNGKFTKQMNSLPVGRRRQSREQRAILSVTIIGHRTAHDPVPLQWNEPAVRDILRSWSDQARSVCLITPPSAFLLDERVFVSLGILKVASSLEAQNYRVNFLDLSGVENFLAPLEDYLTVCQDAAIGITTTPPQLPSVMRIAETVRRLRPDLKLILGGPHVTLVYSAKKLEAKRGIANGRGHRSAAQLEAAFDVLCSGDGELAIFEALKDDTPSLVDGDDPKGGLFLTDRMFTEGPLPARHLVDLKSYRYSIEGHRATSLIAQLGCPFGCGFCGGRNSKSLRQIRNRDTGSILQEVEHLHIAHGYTGFMFYDDELDVSKSFVDLMNGLSDLQSRLGADFGCAASSNPSCLPRSRPRRCSAPASAGCCAASRRPTSASSSTSTSARSLPTTTAASRSPNRPASRSRR